MAKVNDPNPFFEGVLIIDGLIPEDGLWSDLKELLKDIEDLPQPLPWNGFCGLQSYISVHRKMKDNSINPPLEWIASAIEPPRACAAIAFKCEPIKKEQDIDFFINFAECHFHDLARAFTFAANIARPGCFLVKSIAIRRPDGSCEKDTGIVHDLRGAVEYSKKSGWPPLNPQPFGSVWYWIIRNLFHLRLGDSPVSRAFNAYTWLFEKGSDFPFGLVSALIGIEALFSTTTSGIAGQVRRRAQLFLGRRTSFKKDLDKMYAARSAFLHGGTLLRANGYTWEPPKSIQSKLEKISEAEYIASAVLLSSLQRLVEKGWTSLEFSENLIGSEKEEVQSNEELIREVFIPYAKVSEVDEWMTRFIRRFD